MTFLVAPNDPPLGLNLGDAGSVVHNYGPALASYSDTPSPFAAEGTLASGAQSTLYGTQFFTAAAGGLALGVVPLTSGGGGGGTPTKVGADLTELGAGTADGEVGLLRIGTSPNVYELLLTWDAGDAVWRSRPITVVAQADGWAMDLGNYKASDLTGGFSLVTNAIPSGKSYCLLDGAQAANSATLTVDDTSSPHSTPFATAGTILIRDNIITYTGKTGTTFTGCALVAGTGGTMPDNCDVVQGFPGGYGFIATAVPFASDTWDAGFRLQERAIAKLNAAPGGKKISVAPYWTEADNGDGLGPIPTPVSGGLGLSTPIVSGTNDGTGGTKSADAERFFIEAVNDWSTWTAGTPTKQYLIPRVAGKMESGAVDTGQVHNTVWEVRWVGAP